MKNIVDETLELLTKKKEVAVEEIITKLDNEKLNNLKPGRLEAIIATDLFVDGRFILIENKWHLKEEYSMKDIMKEQYRSLGDIDVLETDDTNIALEEVEMEIELDDGDRLETDDAVSIEKIDEVL